jgi:O-antigen biosynthesis protein
LIHHQDKKSKIVTLKIPNKKASPQQTFQQLKDKLKYWIALRAVGSEQSRGGQPSGSRMALKTWVKVLPDWLTYNVLTNVFFGIAIKWVDHQVELMKQRRISKLILFGDGVPEKFSMPAIRNPVVSIIIPVHNKYAFTHKCLYAILQHTTTVSYEVIIADDASTDDTRIIQTNIEHIQVSRNEVSLGFLGNCNKAAEGAKGKYVVLLNNDTMVQPDWLESLLKCMDAEPSVGLVGSKLIYPEGILQEAGGIVWQDGSGWNYGKMFDPLDPEYNYVKEVDYVSGASLIIRMSLWRALGGFDKRFAPAYYEDTDLAFEVRKAGFKVLYQPQSEVVHFEGITHGTDTSSGIKKFQEINQLKFFEKWKYVLSNEQFPREQGIFKARDRSRSQQTMVFIDHYVPEYDKDAGSKSCFQYLKLFVKMGLNVKFIGDDYLKREPYTSVLQQMGIEVLYGFDYQQNWKQWMQQQAADIDFVFLNRPIVAAKYIDTIKQYTKARVIYYGHDLHYLREERQFEITQDRSWLGSAKEWKGKEVAILTQADVVLYPSSVEIDAVKQMLPASNAHVLPLNVYERPTNNIGGMKPKRDLLFVGGFHHMPNEDAVCWFASEIFPIIQQSEPTIRFLVVGSKVTEKVRSLASEHIEIKGYVSDEELTRLYSECRTVVAPLRFGAGVKGKIIEAIYNRCAVVTTPIGAEGINNDAGLLTVASSPKDFADAVLQLYHDENRLAYVFETSPAYISKYFSEEAVKNLMVTQILS